MQMQAEEGSWRLLNPLAIHFSRPKLSGAYPDGSSVQNCSSRVEIRNMEHTVVRGVESPGYEKILVPPFGPIRVISWRAKLRRPHGEPHRDALGEPQFGDRQWYALDNRRLLTVQLAAIKQWPLRCCVVVRCLDDVPGVSEREARKFRTTSQGRSVDVIFPHGEPPQTWNWKHWLRLETFPGDVLTLEQPFPTYLWSASTWAPAATNFAMELSIHERRKDIARYRALARKGGDEDSADEGDTDSDKSMSGTATAASSSAAQYRPPQWNGRADPAQHIAPGPPCHGPPCHVPPCHGPPCHSAAGPDWRALAGPGPAGLAGLAGPGGPERTLTRMPSHPGRSSNPQESTNDMPPDLIPCPASGWEFIDPDGIVQGPFKLEEMRTWHAMGHFINDLRIRCRPSDTFTPLSQSFPLNCQPFENVVWAMRRW